MIMDSMYIFALKLRVTFCPQEQTSSQWGNITPIQSASHNILRPQEFQSPLRIFGGLDLRCVCSVFF